MAQWNTTPESGILRKVKPVENNVDFLVFGYSCKLFRDDEKAVHIDHGKHLIPWMGNDSLKIDRYDCRGALSDLKSYEASREGYDAMRWLGLSESDRNLEKLCDKERYYSLHVNEEEHQLYEEEEKKRQKTNAIHYCYDVPVDPAKDDDTKCSEILQEDEKYVPLPELDVPVDINIPQTVKEHARIEKTAIFVCNQGTQMEILIKAKQGDNPQFSFLNQNDPLYKYYRHVLAALKSGRYQGQSTKTENQDALSDHGSSDEYLHPSLALNSKNMNSETNASTKTVPTIPYKPSANCTYSQLVNRIQGNQNELLANPLPSLEVPKKITTLQEQYYQCYYSSSSFEYCKEVENQHNNTLGANQVQLIQSSIFPVDPSLQVQYKPIVSAEHMQRNHFEPEQVDKNSYAQIVSNLNKDLINPYVLPTSESLPCVLKKSNNEYFSSTQTCGLKDNESNVIVKKPLLSLAQYDSGSEDECDVGEKQSYKIPTGDTKIVIDKMAAYVFKNGEQFENIVKAKGDPRFEFLNELHEFNQYYRQSINRLKIPDQTKTPVSVARKEKKAPVCFSIKKSKEDQPAEIKSALLLEESDEDLNVNDVKNEVVLPPNSTPPMTLHTTTPFSSTTYVSNNQAIKENVIVSEGIHTNVSSKSSTLFDNDDPILEMIDLTDEAEERRDIKRAENKIKDKLAAAAREKLASVSRDRALQLERKKKAMAFLKLKNADSVPSHESAEILDGVSLKKSTKKHSKEMQYKPSCPNDSHHKEKRKKSKQNIVCIEDTDSADDTKKQKKAKRKKSHKRKRSRSQHDNKTKKKSRKRQKRSVSTCSSLTDSA